MATGGSILDACNDLHGRSGLRRHSLLSALLLGGCAMAWIGLLILAVYVPAYGMAAGGDGEPSSFVQLGRWLGERGGWRLVAPVLAGLSLPALAWRLITIIRLYRARRK